MRLVLPLAQRALLPSASATATGVRRCVIVASSSATPRRTYLTAATATAASSASTHPPLPLSHHRHSKPTTTTTAAPIGGSVVGINHNNKKNYTTHSQLPSEHQMVYEMCRKFADEELSPNAGKWDKENSFPVEAVNKLVSICRLVVVLIDDDIYVKNMDLDLMLMLREFLIISHQYYIYLIYIPLVK